MKLDIIIACSPSGGKASRLVKDLFKTSPKTDFNIHLIREKGFRERTLNEGVKFVDQRDLLILGDDIELTRGWDEALIRYKKQGDIIGFSMLYPNSNIIQDNGYDLIKIDERITLDPQNRGKNTKQVKKFSYRTCDAVNGCAVFINRRVLKKLRYFSEDGMNRWGEFIFAQRAKKLGFKVVVLGHFLYHQGKSTKSNKDIKFSSISWQKEKNSWQKVIKKYVDKKNIKLVYKTKLSRKFRNLLNSDNRILVYGIGTVAELIAKNSDLNNLDFCSGLKEEVGMEFFGKKVIFYPKVRYEDYDYLIISPLFIAEKIYRKIDKYLDSEVKVFKVDLDKKNKLFNYNLIKI